MFRRFRAQRYASDSPFEPTPEEIYYNTEQHFHEMPYRLGDRLPRSWHMSGGWPSWGRPAQVTGERACNECAGRGWLLYAHVISQGDISQGNYTYYSVLGETSCDACKSTGIEGERRRRESERFLQESGYASYDDYWKAEAIKAEERRRATREYQRQLCKKCAGTGVELVGWEFAAPVRCRRCGGSGKRFFW